MGLSIVECEEARVPALQAFFRRTYRADYALCDLALLRWQFQHPPGGDGTRWHIKLACDGDTIAACLGFIPVHAHIDGVLTRAAWVINWMVDAGHQQYGLGPLLMREVMREFDVTLNVGPNQAARDVLARMRWWSAGELPRYVAVLDPAAVAALAAAETLTWPERSLELTAAIGSSTAQVTRVARYSDEATALWDRLAGSEDGRVAGTRRSAAFLNWRYADHPAFKYRMFAQYDAAALTGVAVYRVEIVRGTQHRVGRLVEYLEAVDRDRPDSALLAAVLADARSMGVSLVDFFCADPAPARRLAQHGFVADPALLSPVPVLFQPIDRGRSGIPFMAQSTRPGVAVAVQPWYVTKGDGDQDRPN